MSSLWQDLDQADITERKGHAARIATIGRLLETYPRPTLIGMLSARYQVSGARARSWVREAKELGELPDLAHAYEAGELSQDQVAALRVLAKPGEDGGWVETLASPLGLEDFQIQELQRLARRETARNLERTDQGRYLKMASTPDERFVKGDFQLHPEEAAAFETTLDASIPDGTRWQDYPTAYADALMALVRQAGGGPPTGKGPGAGMKALVVVRSEQAVLDGTSDAPGELVTGDFVPAGVVREMAEAGRVLTLDLAGVDLDGEQIPAAVRRYIWYRDQGRCRRTDCVTPTLGLEIHHLTKDGPEGKHHPRRLALLCWPCHQVKIHRHGWRLIGDAEGKLAWLRPDGSIHKTTAGDPANPRTRHTLIDGASGRRKLVQYRPPFTGDRAATQSPGPGPSLSRSSSGWVTTTAGPSPSRRSCASQRVSKVSATSVQLSAEPSTTRLSPTWLVCRARTADGRARSTALYPGRVVWNSRRRSLQSSRTPLGRSSPAR